MTIQLHEQGQTGSKLLPAPYSTTGSLFEQYSQHWNTDQLLALTNFISTHGLEAATYTAAFAEEIAAHWRTMALATDNNRLHNQLESQKRLLERCYSLIEGYEEAITAMTEQYRVERNHYQAEREKILDTLAEKKEVATLMATFITPPAAPEPIDHPELDLTPLVDLYQTTHELLELLQTFYRKEPDEDLLLVAQSLLVHSALDRASEIVRGVAQVEGIDFETLVA